MLHNEHPARSPWLTHPAPVHLHPHQAGEKQTEKETVVNVVINPFFTQVVQGKFFTGAGSSIIRSSPLLF